METSENIFLNSFFQEKISLVRLGFSELKFLQMRLSA